MRKKLYVDIKMSEFNYLIIKELILKEEMENNFKELIELMRITNSEKFECLEGHELKYVKLEVEFDGRTKK